MNDKRYNMTYNNEHYTVMANDIVKARQSMSLQAARLIRLMISKVVKEDKDLKTYTCNITELAEFLNISRNNLYRDIEDICNTLHQSIVYIGTGNPKHPWKRLNWISMSEYDGKGTLTIRLSDDIKPYVIELERCFTQYQLKNILNFNSYYAIRLYEIIKCEDGRTLGTEEKMRFTIKELREYCDCIDKYTRLIDFKRNVIEVAVREINTKSDLYIIPHYIKTGRAITDIDFEIHVNCDINNTNSPLHRLKGK